MRTAAFTRVLKRSLCMLLSIVFSFSILMVGGCNKKVVIDDYPELSAPSTSGDDTQAEDVDASENTSLGEVDSLFSEGKFHYNPEAINPTYLKELEKKPLTVSIAKKIMKAVYDCETEFVLTGDEKDIHEFEKGLKLACWSSPLVNCVDITTDDYETFKVIYFPEYSDDGMTEGDVDEAKAKFEEYEDFVEGLINKVNEYLDRMERVPDNLDYHPEPSVQLTLLLNMAAQQVLSSSAKAIDIPHLTEALLDFRHMLVGERLIDAQIVVSPGKMCGGTRFLSRTGAAGDGIDSHVAFDESHLCGGQ